MSFVLKAAKVRSLGRQGDPGLFDFLGKAVGGVARAVTGIGSAIGIPGMGVANRAAQVLLPPRNTPPVGIIPAARAISQLLPFPKGGVPLLPGGGLGIAQDLGLRIGGGGGTALNKNGTPRRIRMDGKPYKRPSMNFANGRAIKRASRRLEGAEKMFRRVFSIRHGAVHGKILPKRAR